MLKEYVGEILRETSFRILGLLGIVSTIATFFPQLQSSRVLRPLGLIAIVLGYAVANYRIYVRYANGARARRQELLDELRFNADRLRTITAITASELRAEHWEVVSATPLGMADDFRTRVNNLYMNI